MNSVLEPSQPISCTSSRPILVVDDDDDVCAFLVTVLSRWGTVAQAADGVEALRVARLVHPSLIICDSEMPRMRGQEVIRAMQRDPLLADIPFIITSGYPRCEVLDGDCNPAAFLEKPFMLDELIAAIDQVLEHRHSEA